jgi:hypothetical protein
MLKECGGYRQSDRIRGLTPYENLKEMLEKAVG